MSELPTPTVSRQGPWSAHQATPRRRAVGVAGPAEPEAGLAELAGEVGRGLAEHGAAVVCGGLGGVMEAACRGAKEVGGTTVGLLPGDDPRAANPWVDVVVPTGLGQARNVLVVRASHALIAVGGSWGTMSEVAHAQRAGVPVVTLASWSIRDSSGREVPGPLPARDAAHAVHLALSAAAAPGP